MNRFSPFAALALAACASASAQSRPVADSASVATILGSARGANALMCEMAARMVEQNGGWGGISFDLRAPADPAERSALEAIRRERMPVNAVPMLSAALGDDDACVRRVAAPLLGRVDDPAAWNALRQALRDPRPATREVAAIAMGYAGKPVLIPALLAGLQDAEARVRTACAIALGEISDKRATGALTRLLREDRDSAVRAAAAWAIGSIEG